MRSSSTGYSPFGPRISGRHWNYQTGGGLREQAEIIRLLKRSVKAGMILVDHNRRRRLQGHIFVVPKSEGLVVKRAEKEGSGTWRLVSGHPA